MDAILLRRWIHTRDAEAFRELAHKHLPMIYATCLRILRDSSDAEDVSQECLLTLAGVRQTVPERVGPWLHRVATNKSLNVLRTNARRSRHENDAACAAVGPTEHAHAHDDVYACVDELIQQLPDELRNPLISHFFQGKTHADIAASLGVTRSAVTHRIDQAIRRIREELRRRGHACSAIALTASLEAIRTQPLPVPEVLTHATARIAVAGLGAVGTPVSSGAAAGLTNGMLAAVFGQKVAVFAVSTAILFSALLALTTFGKRDAAPTPQSVAIVDPQSPHTRVDMTPTEKPIGAQSSAATSTKVTPPKSQGTGSISGIVVSAYGAPQHGKSVYALGPTETGTSIVHGTIDSHGQFSLTELSENNYALRLQRADALGPEQIDRAIVRVANAQHVSGIRIVSRDVGLSISGKVTDENGNPIAGVLVRYGRFGEYEIGRRWTVSRHWNSGRYLCHVGSSSAS